MNRPHPSSILYPSSSPSPRTAFTLIELLVVLALLVLALAAAVPAFNAITGSRSTDAAENMVGAMLQRARAQAIQSARPTGVAFFVNPRDQRATMALVVRTASTNGLAEETYSNYRGWSHESWQQLGNTSVLRPNPNGPRYAEGHEAYALFLDDMGATNSDGTVNNDSADRYRNRGYTFVRDNTSGAGNDPPPRLVHSGSPPPGGNVPWRNPSGSTVTSAELATVDLLPDAAFEPLPAGIAVQTINDPKGVARDKYLQLGVILFDADGRVTSVPFAFQKGSQAYNLLARNPATGPSFLPESINTSNTIYSQLGLVIYDRGAFLSQPGATEGDTLYMTGGAGGLNVTQLTGPTLPGLEAPEEAWLDRETTPLFVNRSNGTLLKGQ